MYYIINSGGCSIAMLDYWRVFFLLNFSRSFGAFGCPGVVILGNLSNGCFNPIMGNTWEFLSLNSWQNRPLVKPPCVSCKDHGILRTFQSKKNEIYTSFTCLCSVLNYCTYLYIYNPISAYGTCFTIIYHRKGMSWVQDMTRSLQILWFHHDHHRATCERGMEPGWGPSTPAISPET